jgi:hypothetical protein
MIRRFTWFFISGLGEPKYNINRFVLQGNGDFDFEVFWG